MKSFPSATTIDLVRRVSSFAEVPPASLPSCYQEQTTSFPVLEPTAGERAVVRVRDKRWAGLYIHSFVMGFVSTVLPLTVYPFLTGYLNMEGTQTLSARSLLALPWILRPLFRSFAASTSAPESSRYRRCLGLGWLVASAALTASSVLDPRDPYFPKAVHPAPLSQLNSTDLGLVNVAAPARGAIFVMLMAVATVGLVLADVGADVLIEQTANEYFPPLAEGVDSPFVYDITVKRVAGMLAAFVFMGFTLNGEDYGGDFSFTIGYGRVMTIVSLVTIPPGPCSKFFITERTPGRTAFSSYVQTMWKIFQNPAINRIIACGFISGILRGVTATPGNPIAMYWANVQPINANVISLVATLAAIGIMRLGMKKGWVLNEVRVLVVANVVFLVLDCSITMATIWDVVRSKYLWIGMPLLQALPSALDCIILNVVLGEIAESNTAELTRELVVAVSILASSLGAVLTKLIDASFNVSNDDILQDSHSVRSNAMIVFIIAYAAQLLSLAWIFVLPRRGDAIREWKLQYANPSPRQGAVLVVVLAVGIWISFTVHVLSVNPSTSCFWFAGGNGCH